MRKALLSESDEISLHVRSQFIYACHLQAETKLEVIIDWITFQPMTTDATKCSTNWATDLCQVSGTKTKW